MKIENKKKYVTVFLLAALLLVMIYTARWGLADIYAHQARKPLEQWQQEKPKHISDTTNAMRWIVKARALDPNNPNLMNYQAQIFQWQARISSSKEETHSYLELAAQLYRDALSSRPTWPYDWVALVEIKAQLEQFDSEFSKAIERSNTLGPWEYPIQLNLVQTGFKHWSQLTSTEQDIIHQSFDRALQGNRFKIFIQLAQQYDQLELFCARTNRGSTHSKIIQTYACP